MAQTYTLKSYLERSGDIGSLLDRNLNRFDTELLAADLYASQSAPVMNGVAQVTLNHPYLHGSLDAYLLDEPRGPRIPANGNWPDFTPDTTNGEHLTQAIRFEDYRRAVLDFAAWIEGSGLDLAEIDVEEALTDLLMAYPRTPVGEKTVRRLAGLMGPSELMRILDEHFTNGAQDGFLAFADDLDDQGDDLDQDTPQAPLNLSGGNFHV